MYLVELESDTNIWLYDSERLLGKLVWRSEDETREEFESSQTQLINRKDIANSYLLPSFLDDNIFALQ